MIRDLAWRAVASLVSRPAVADWLIARSKRTPYAPIKGPDGSLYMGRWWLFNPYPPATDGGKRKWGEWIPSVRIHHICRPDRDQHLHDHPWNARTFILRGWYHEERHEPGHRAHLRRAVGDTAGLNFGEYHRITHLSDGGVWTLFITWKYRGKWGFLVDGAKVHWRDYLKASTQ